MMTEDPLRRRSFLEFRCALMVWLARQVLGVSERDRPVREQRREGQCPIRGLRFTQADTALVASHHRVIVAIGPGDVG